MPTTYLDDLKRRVVNLPCSQRLILAGQLFEQDDVSVRDLAIVIAEHVVAEWQAIRLLDRKV